MDAHFLKRHQSAKVVVALLTTKIERGVHSISLDPKQAIAALRSSVCSAANSVEKLPTIDSLRYNMPIAYYAVGVPR